ncbi:stage II sporulation protein M [Mahella australiensis]|uniref:Stage II sporulation protein M n=1 Tax=Mahella australiensis (strain DSM 15567 / CIP 107919 / 50-1 BON) TaxID=697281 RepID=F3ZXX6_MAHA5|nr:stage II sporulation protein M [Mahella australiensis]AEE96646.1 stage II sporulation protein M [Mahella australiensis 50-1 BON]
MKNGIKSTLIRHISDNWVLYIIVLFAFIVGIAAGSFSVGAMDETQRSELIDTINNFFVILGTTPMDTSAIFKQSLLNNGEMALLSWVFGLIAIIGVPLIFLLIVVRGFVIGFTVGFMVKEFAYRGLLFVTLSMLPSNIISIPISMAMAVVSTRYSIYLWKNRQNIMDKAQRRQQFLIYTVIVLILFGALLIATLIETFIAPALVSLFSDALK